MGKPQWIGLINLIVSGGIVLWFWTQGLLYLGIILGGICLIFIGAIATAVDEAPSGYDWKEDDEDQSIREEQHLLHVGPFADQPPF